MSGGYFPAGGAGKWGNFQLVEERGGFSHLTQQGKLGTGRIRLRLNAILESPVHRG